MRCYKLMLAVFMALGLWACSAAPLPDAATPPVSEAVTPAADMSASAATAEEARQGAEAAPGPFPGQANMIPTIKAVTEFCNRPGSLAFMTRDGCRGALSQLSRDISGNLHFESMEDCQDFLQKRRADRHNIVAAHREWCERNYDNLHDRKGCYDAAPVFLGSFTDQGFCRKLPPPKPKPEQPVDTEAPYIYGYSEPGQKFDSPKTGPAPTVNKAAAVKKAPVQKAAGAAPVPAEKDVVGQTVAPATAPTPVAGTAASQAPQGVAAPAQPVGQQSVAPPFSAPAGQALPDAVVSGGPRPSSPALNGQAIVSPAGPSQIAGAPVPVEDAPAQAPAGSLPAAPADGLAPQAPEDVPSWPAAMDFSNTPEAQGGQTPNATTGPNAVSPTAVPEAFRATAGGQVEAGAVLPRAAEQPGTAPVIPVLPVPGASVTQDLPEPTIGPREEVEALPPVPSIGRIAPQLMPGVPPDTAVSDNTLPDETEAPQVTEVPQGSPLGADAFGDIIPNFMPPPPPNPLEGQTQPMPLSGAPAGQAGP